MLSPAVYSETVEPLSLSRFDGEQCCFYVIVRDAEQSEWLVQRFQRTLERALTGACGREARVRFVLEEW
jgi:hypothetical protein